MSPRREIERMMDLILPAFRLNLWYSRKLVEDVAEDQMCAQPVAGRVVEAVESRGKHLLITLAAGRTALVR